MSPAQHLIRDEAPARVKNDVNIVPVKQPKYTAFGYQAASYARESNIHSTAGSADYDMRYDRPLLVGMGRTLYRDNWLVKSLVNRATDYILGPTGFTLQARTADEDLNHKIEQEIWPAITESPEIRGLFDWPEFQALVLRECMVPGDQGMIKMGGEDPQIAGKLQHIEAERIGPPSSNALTDGRVEQGVVLNAAGKPVAYQICSVDPFGYVRSSAARRIPAENFLYVGQPFERSSQTRCVPIFCSGLPLAHRLDDVLTAATIAWQIQSRLVVGIYRDKNKMRPAIKSGTNAGTKASLSDSNTDMSRLVTEMGYSIIFQGEQGDEIKPIAQNRPGANLKDDVLTFVRLFCAPLGMPAEVLLLFWPDFNYSSGRIVLLQAFVAFRRLQRHLVRKFFTPHYRWQIGRAIADGRLPWREDILDHEWQVPSWPWIDEDKEMSAWAKKIDRCIATQTAALASLGLDREEQQSVRQGEIIAAWENARKIETSTGGGIKAAELWRHLAGLETGKTESAVRAKPEPTKKPTLPPPPEYLPNEDEDDAQSE